MKVRVASIAPVAANALARVRPPSRKRPVMLLPSELREGGMDPVRVGLAAAIRISAPASLRASRRDGPASVPTTIRTEDRSRVARSWESSGRRAAESKTTRRGCRARRRAGRQQRVVGEDGADADRDRVGFGTPAVDQPAAALARYPGRVSRRGRGRAVDGHRQLQRHQRQAGAGVLAEGLVQQPGRRRLGAGRELDLDPAVAEDSGAATGRLLGRVVGADHDPRDAGLEDRVRARGLAAVMGAGLEGHVHRRPGRVLAARSAILESGPLGVKAAEGRVEAFTDDRAAADDHRADQRVRADPAAASLGQLQRLLEVRPIRGCQLGVHRLIDQSINVTPALSPRAP